MILSIHLKKTGCHFTLTLINPRTLQLLGVPASATINVGFEGTINPSFTNLFVEPTMDANVHPFPLIACYPNHLSVQSMTGGRRILANLILPPGHKVIGFSELTVKNSLDIDIQVESF